MNALAFDQVLPQKDKLLKSFLHFFIYTNSDRKLFQQSVIQVVDYICFDHLLFCIYLSSLHDILFIYSVSVVACYLLPEKLYIFW